MTARYVMSHGRRIEVETLDTCVEPTKTRRREAGLFIKVPVPSAIAMTKATRTPKALIGMLLLHLAWRARSKTFPVSNEMLKRYGVTRETKRRALAELEAAGLIKVERRRGRAPVVTVTGL